MCRTGRGARGKGERWVRCHLQNIRHDQGSAEAEAAAAAAADAMRHYPRRHRLDVKAAHLQGEGWGGKGRKEERRKGEGLRDEGRRGEGMMGSWAGGKGDRGNGKWEMGNGTLDVGRWEVGTLGCWLLLTPYMAGIGIIQSVIRDSSVVRCPLSVVSSGRSRLGEVPLSASTG